MKFKDLPPGAFVYPAFFALFLEVSGLFSSGPDLEGNLRFGVVAGAIASVLFFFGYRLNVGSRKAVPLVLLVDSASLFAYGIVLCLASPDKP